MRHRMLSLTVTVLLLALCPLPAPAQQYTIKFATVAPEGSTWIKIMREYDKAVRAATGGKAGFRIYPGAVAGDEKDVIRKIRLGQYHAGGFTGVGLGEIARRVRILDAPFLFRSYEEVDFIRDKYDAEFRKAFEDGGFVLLGWAEVGFVYIYSDRPVASPADLKATKMWMWEGDPIAQAAFQAIGVSPIQLSLTDVSTSLQTGMINTVYNAPYALVALQWFTRVKHVMSEPLAISNGAVVMSKKLFDSMPPEVQEALLTNGRKFFRDLTLASRKENHDAIETLKKNGIATTVPLKSVAATFEQTGAQARRLLVNSLYTQQFLDDVENSLRGLRQQVKGK